MIFRKGQRVEIFRKSDDEGWENETKHPINLGLYIQDRFDWRGLIVNAGVRFDYFDYKALRIRDPHNPFDPDGYLNDGVVDSAQDASGLVLDESDLEESEKFTRLSPRIGISFPVSDRTQMHINFGKFFQRPDLRRLYTGYDFFEARILGGSFYPFAMPNLEPEKITQYEIGMNHQLGELVPQMERLTGNLEDTQITIQEIQTSIPESVAMIRKIMIILFSMLIFTQVPSMFMGGLLVSGALFPTRSSSDDNNETSSR